MPQSLRPSLPRRLYEALPAAVVVLIGVCYVLISSTVSLQGDDLDIAMSSSWVSGRHFWLFPRYCARFWLFVNGRLQNVLAPFFFQYVPPAALWVCNGVFTALLFWMAVRCAELRSVAGRMLMIALLAFTLPWWDVFLLFDVAIGYCWGSAIALMFLYAFLNVRHLPSGRWMRAALMLLSLLAGGMHESLFFSLACGLCAYLIINREWTGLGRDRRWMLAAFCLGGLYAVSSPGIWGRLAGERIVDGPWWQLLLVSSFYCLVLLGLVIFLAIAAPARLKALCRGPWVAYAVAALASLPVVAVGGIVGRPGVYGQVFALVAIALWARKAVPFPAGRPGAVVALVLTAALAFHYGEFLRYQWQVGAEQKRALELYADSPDGTVYMDYTSDLDIPWWVLRKTRGVPDEDDFYINYIYTCHLGDTTKVWRVLPAELAHLPADSLTDGRRVGRGRVALTPRGQEAKLGFGSLLVTAPGQPDSVAVPITGTAAYYLAPRDYDPSGSW